MEFEAALTYKNKKTRYKQRQAENARDANCLFGARKCRCNSCRRRQQHGQARQLAKYPHMQTLR